MQTGSLPIASPEPRPLVLGPSRARSTNTAGSLVVSWIASDRPSGRGRCLSLAGSLPVTPAGSPPAATYRYLATAPRSAVGPAAVVSDHARRAPVPGQHDFRGTRAPGRQLGREPNPATSRHSSALTSERRNPPNEQQPGDHGVRAAGELGLPASGARGQTPQVTGTGSYPLEWTSNGSGSSIEGGLVRGGRSASTAANETDPKLAPT